MLLGPMIDDLPGAGLYALSVALLLGSVEWWHRRRRPPPEWSRKLVHAGAGLVSLSLPWLVSSSGTVACLAVGFVGLLVAGRRAAWLGCIHGVERRTSGAYLYPVAVWGLFALSGGDALRFGIPLAVLAFADSAAALAGSVPRQPHYWGVKSGRSLEGSFAFFVVAYMATLTGLVLAGAPGGSTVVVALAVAALTTGAEGVSAGGTDNLFVPAVAWLVLEGTLGRPPMALAGWVLGAALSVAPLALALRRGERSRRRDFVGGALAGAPAMALGGWSCGVLALASWTTAARPTRPVSPASQRPM